MIESEPLQRLLLVPTEFEKTHISTEDQTWFQNRGVRIEVVGFGPVAAAARTSQLIARYAPAECLLLGISGGYRNRVLVGDAMQFSEVALHGIGAGSGGGYSSAAELGWPMISSDQQTIGDRVFCDESREPASLLLTVCSASSGQADVEEKLSRFPNAIAEDMEGFGVALACQLNRCPLKIVRGISNVAGDRDKSNWKIPEAMNSAIGILKGLCVE